MFHFFDDGFGGFYVVPVGPADGLLGGAVGFVFVLLMLGLGVFVKDLLVLPVIILLLAMALALAFARQSALSALTPLALPLFAYGLTSVGWTLFSATAFTEWGIVSLMAWLLVAMGILVMGGTMCAENGLSGVIFLAVMVVLWFAAFLADRNDPSAGSKVVFYTFRVIHIATAVMAAVNLIMYLWNVMKRKASLRATVYDVLMLLLGFVPLIAGGIFGGLAGGAAGSVIFVVLIAAIYAALGAASKAIGKKFGDPDSPAALLLLPFLGAGSIHFAVTANAQYLAPLRSAAHILSMLHDRPWSGFGAQAQTIVEALTGLFSLIFNFVMSLILRIFDTSIPDLGLPQLLCFALGLIVLFVAICIGEGMYDKIKKK